MGIGPSRLSTRNPKRTSIGVPGHPHIRAGPGAFSGEKMEPLFPGHTGEASGMGEREAVSAELLSAGSQETGPLLVSKESPGRFSGDTEEEHQHREKGWEEC